MKQKIHKEFVIVKGDCGNLYFRVDKEDTELTAPFYAWDSVGFYWNAFEYGKYYGKLVYHFLDNNNKKYWKTVILIKEEPKGKIMRKDIKPQKRVLDLAKGFLKGW